MNSPIRSLQGIGLVSDISAVFIQVQHVLINLKGFVLIVQVQLQFEFHHFQFVDLLPGRLASVYEHLLVAFSNTQFLEQT